MSLYNAAVKPNDYARLSEFVSQLFNALAQMVQSKVIQDVDTLGITLGAIFDWCISLLYAEKTANTGWLYCQWGSTHTSRVARTVDEWNRQR